MKVLFVANDPLVFEPASAVRERMRQYAVAIGELHIVSLGKKGAKAEQEGPLFLHPVTGPKLWARLWMARKVRSLIREYGIEVVSAQDPFEMGRIAFSGVTGTKAWFHIQVHTDFLTPTFARESIKNRIRILLADRVLKEAHGIRVVSKRIRDHLLLRYGDHIVSPSIIPIAPAITAPAPVAFPPAPFSFKLLFVGRLEREKRIEDILAALRLVRSRYPGTGLFVIGTGRERSRIEKQVRTLGLADCVVFLGERADARALMASANALVQASAYEGYGRTYVEAALARLPIISTDVGIIGELFTPEREALVCPVGQPACIAGHIARLIEDNQLRRALAVNAEAAALAHLASYGNVPQLIADDLGAAHATPKGIQ